MCSVELQDIALQKSKIKNPGYRTMSRRDKMGCLMLWLKIKLEPSGGPKEGCQGGRTKEKRDWRISQHCYGKRKS